VVAVVAEEGWSVVPEPSVPQRPCLASLTKYIPYAGIAHAGGRYVEEHYRALSSDWRIEATAPDTPDNAAAARRVADVESVDLVRGRGLFAGGRFKPLADLEAGWAGSSVSRNVRAEFRRPQAQVWARLARSSLIEFQWSEMFALAEGVRSHLPTRFLVGVAHDVITQRWERAADAARPPVDLAYRLAAARSRGRERRSLAALDVVIVFSDKDAALVRDLSPATPVEVVHPGLGPEGPLPARTRDDAEPVVLFTGALNRADNHNGIEWFVQRVWPTVLRAVPSARLVIAGAHPRPALERTVARADRVSLTGYVASLEPSYASASVFVAPLFTGAGVKFKTIEAMLRGVPVVATPVGAEGIAGAHLLAGRTEDPTEFATAVVDALGADGVARAGEARAWAEAHYGAAAFARRLRELYARFPQAR
jgi:glycosyltransferase involved in cell wall biosynthesis